LNHRKKREAPVIFEQLCLSSSWGQEKPLMQTWQHIQSRKKEYWVALQRFCGSQPGSRAAGCYHRPKLFILWNIIQIYNMNLIYIYNYQ